MKTDHFIAQLKEAGLKVTPQRLTIFEAVVELKNHPSAENVIDHIKTKHPNISVGTVYKVLNSLVENGLLKKVKSETETTRYDAILQQHHHLYCSETKRIEDFEDPQLDQLINDYFEKKKINSFKIKNITLQITGEFSNT
ncbi:MAG: transcriptional repressor [Bacteroidales bacterium]|nr:transcriptional repressor [Bacteroidales bacterium]